MNTLRVTDYNDPVDFLNATLSSIQEANPQFSMRAWSKQLGLSHVAMLSMVLAKKRRLLPGLSGKISRQFQKMGRFSETDARYFDILVLFNNAGAAEEKIFYQGILSTLRPEQNFSTLQLDHLRIVSDWYHIAILEMTRLKNFSSDPEWICQRLGSTVNLSQVKEAVERLVRLGLLEKTTRGGLKKTSVRLATPTDIPNRSLRQFHAEMIRRAGLALEEQPTHERDITGHMMVVDVAKLPEGKRMIQDFRRKFAEFMESSGGDRVYQLNVQFFNVLDEKIGVPHV